MLGKRRVSHSPYYRSPGIRHAKVSRVETVASDPGESLRVLWFARAALSDRALIGLIRMPWRLRSCV